MGILSLLLGLDIVLLSEILFNDPSRLQGKAMYFRTDLSDPYPNFNEPYFCENHLGKSETLKRLLHEAMPSLQMRSSCPQTHTGSSLKKRNFSMLTGIEIQHINPLVSSLNIFNMSLDARLERALNYPCPPKSNFEKALILQLVITYLALEHKIFENSIEQYELSDHLQELFQNLELLRGEPDEFIQFFLNQDEMNDGNREEILKFLDWFDEVAGIDTSYNEGTLKGEKIFVRSLLDNLSRLTPSIEHEEFFGKIYNFLEDINLTISNFEEIMEDFKVLCLKISDSNLSSEEATPLIVHIAPLGLLLFKIKEGQLLEVDGEGNGLERIPFSRKTLELHDQWVRFKEGQLDLYRKAAGELEVLMKESNRYLF